MSQALRRMPGTIHLALLPLLTAIVATPIAAQDSLAVPSSLSLLQAIQLGRQQAVGASLANMGARMAKSRVGIKRADLLPQISGAASITPQTLNLEAFGFPGTVIGVTPPFTIYDLRASASQMIFDASAIERLKAAADSASVAGLDAQHAGALAGTAAGLAYLRVLATGEVVVARGRDSVIAAELLAQARQLQAAGVTPAIDLTRNEVNVRAVQTELLTARNQEARARLDLLRILNLPLGAPVHLTDSLGTPPADLPLDPATAVPFALEHRPDVAAEAGRTAVATRSLRAVKNEYLPSVGFTGTWDFAGQETSDLLYSYRLYFGVQVPIFDGMRRQHRAEEAAIRLEAQEIRQLDVSRQAEQDVRRALLDLASAESAVAIATDRLQLADLELRQARERFDAGVAGSVETTQAQAVVVAARNALIQARAAYGMSRITLYQSLGVLERLQ